jgi:DNA-binding LacI/PurR family transcriptional regulator
VNVHIVIEAGAQHMETPRVRAPNIRDVARLAGVSYQTVSRVLNDSPSIKPSTRQRVLDVIEEIGYRPNQAARALVTSRSRTIGVLTTGSAHYGPTMSALAIENAARQAGYLVTSTGLASQDAESITDSLNHLMAQAVEGLVVIAPHARVFEAISRLHLTIPVVTLDSAARDHARSLSVDQITGARLAARHLISLGHRDILHLAGPQDWIEAEARMTGFLEEVGSAGLRTLPPILGDWTADFGYRAGRQLLRLRDFTAVFAANDHMALGVVHAIRDAGLDVPGDISVIGFDDVPESQHFWPPLSTVRQDFVELGRRALALLMSELRGEESPGNGQIEPELIVRSSTAPPRC